MKISPNTIVTRREVRGEVRRSKAGHIKHGACEAGAMAHHQRLKRHLSMKSGVRPYGKEPKEGVYLRTRISSYPKAE